MRSIPGSAMHARLALIAIAAVLLLGAVLLLSPGSGSNQSHRTRTGVNGAASGATRTAHSPANAGSGAAPSNASLSGKQIYDRLVQKPSGTWAEILSKMPLSEVQRLSDFVASTGPEYEQIYGSTNPTAEKLFKVQVAVFAALAAKTPPP